MPEEFRSESKYVAANGINHHYLEWGDPETPPIVMLHGLGLCAQVWNKLARGLAQDYHVLSFDLRGHGDTDKPGSGYTFQKLGEDVSAIIQKMGLERPFAVGHSAGGMSLLISDHLVPGIVGRTVLVDTRVGAAATTTLTSERRQERMRRTREKRPIWRVEKLCTNHTGDEGYSRPGMTKYSTTTSKVEPACWMTAVPN